MIFKLIFLLPLITNFCQATNYNVVLVGQTGQGKSTLANVLTESEFFKVGSGSISETKECLYKEVYFDGDTYRIIDTIGLGDTKLNETEVLKSISGSFEYMGEGVNQILFIYKDRLTESQLHDYSLIRNVMFGQNISEHITIVHNSPSFNVLSDNRELECEKDKTKVLKERSSGAEIIGSSRNFICINPNPFNSMFREKSREILLKNLRDFKKVVHLDFKKLTELIKNHIPEEQRLINNLESITRDKEEAERLKKEAEKRLEEEKRQAEIARRTAREAEEAKRKAEEEKERLKRENEEAERKREEERKREKKEQERKDKEWQDKLEKARKIEDRGFVKFARGVERFFTGRWDRLGWDEL